MKKFFFSLLMTGSILSVAAQKIEKQAPTYPDSIAPVGIIKIYAMYRWYIYEDSRCAEWT